MKTALILTGIFVSFFSFCQPNWKVMNFTSSTTAYGIVMINNQPAEAGDKIGAFVGNECRALNEVIINNGTAYVTLQIQGESTELVNFKIWDKSLDKIYNADRTVQSSPGNIIGMPPNYLNISVSNTTSAYDNFDQMMKVIIYPNPCSDVININCSFYIKKVVLFDINGKKIIELIDNPARINMSNLPKGIYSLVVSDNFGRNFIKKLAK